MDKHIGQGKWSEIKGRIKAQWARFTDDDLKSFESNLEELKGRLEKVYGYTKDQAKAEYDRFVSHFRRPQSNDTLSDLDKKVS